MKRFALSLLIFATLSASVEAGLFSRLRARFQDRRGHSFVSRQASSGCADCKAHGVGPDGYRIK